MKKVQQEVLCALLQTLREKELITQELCDKSRARVLDTLKWPEFFCCMEDDGRGEEDGHL